MDTKTEHVHLIRGKFGRVIDSSHIQPALLFPHQWIRAICFRPQWHTYVLFDTKRHNIFVSFRANSINRYCVYLNSQKNNKRKENKTSHVAFDQWPHFSHGLVCSSQPTYAAIDLVVPSFHPQM